MAMIGVLLFVNQNLFEERRLAKRIEIVDTIQGIEAASAAMEDLKEQVKSDTDHSKPTYEDFHSKVNVAVALALYSGKNSSNILCKASSYEYPPRFPEFKCEFVNLVSDVRTAVEVEYNAGAYKTSEIFDLTCASIQEEGWSSPEAWAEKKIEIGEGKRKYYAGLHIDRLSFSELYGFPFRTFSGLTSRVFSSENFTPDNLSMPDFWWFVRQIRVPDNFEALGSDLEIYEEIEERFSSTQFGFSENTRTLLYGEPAYPSSRFLVDELYEVFLEVLLTNCHEGGSSALREIYDGRISSFGEKGQSQQKLRELEVAGRSVEQMNFDLGVLREELRRIEGQRFSEEVGFGDRVERLSHSVWPFFLVFALSLKFGKYFSSIYRKRP
ncbi:MAG: hypothetical protein ABJL67_09320 [Sulfitobacter sp.]